MRIQLRYMLFICVGIAFVCWCNMTIACKMILCLIINNNFAFQHMDSVI